MSERERNLKERVIEPHSLLTGNFYDCLSKNNHLGIIYLDKWISRRMQYIFCHVTRCHVVVVLLWYGCIRPRRWTWRDSYTSLSTMILWRLPLMETNILIHDCLLIVLDVIRKELYLLFYKYSKKKKSLCPLMYFYIFFIVFISSNWIKNLASLL